MQAVYREDHVWCALTSDPDSDGQTEVVWQDIDTQGVANGPTINQSGFINGTGADQWTYLPSIDVNAAGDTTICYTQSSATRCPGVYYTTRLAGDAPGTMRTLVSGMSKICRAI